VNPPRHVTVGPYRYELVISAAEVARANRTDGELRLGLTDHRNLRILVCDDAADQVVQETTLHEVLHAAFAASGLSTPAGADEEERLVAALSPVLYGALRANKGLVSWLTS
jgi:hypothetical protein